MKIIIILFLLLIVAIFSIQNSGIVTFRFFNQTFEASLAIILIISFLAGVLSGIIYMLPSFIRKNIQISKLMEKDKRPPYGESK